MVLGDRNPKEIEMTKYNVFVGKVYVTRVFADNEVEALIEAYRQLSKPGRAHVLRNGRLTVVTA